MGHSSYCRASLGHEGAKLNRVKGDMKTRRGGTVQDPITPGAPPPLPQPSCISHHWEQPGDARAPRLRPSQGGAGEDLCRWASHPRARLGTAAPTAWARGCLDNCSWVSPHNSAPGLHPPTQACSQPGPPARQKRSLHTRASRIRPPAHVHLSLPIALRSANHFKSVKTTAFSELTAP